MATKKGRKDDGMELHPWIHSAAAEAYHQRFLYPFDEALGKLLRENPDVAERINELTAEIFEILAAGLRRQSGGRRRAPTTSRRS